MSNTNTGGPAFPWCGDLNECPTINLGISIRDYFAAKAMQTYMHNEIWNPDTYKNAAEKSYRMADAMLRAREAS